MATVPKIVAGGGEKIRNRPEIALTRLELAELLLDRYPEERAEAMEHLDFAIGELRDMKMQPSLERAMSHRDILKAQPGSIVGYSQSTS